MTTEEIKQLVVAKANQYGIDPNIALAQMQRESGWRQDVIFGPFVGGAGERGISQFTPATWKDYGSGPHTNAYNPELALDAWGRYMIALIAMFNGDYLKALQGYNGGPGNVQRGTVSAAAKAYAQAIYNQAGFTESSVVNLDQVTVSPGDFPVWLIIGAAGLLLWFAFSD
jgi:soluble lytic murein transglycosylase-like protein